MATSSAMASGSRTQIEALSAEQQENIIRQRMQVDERPLRRLIKKLTSLLACKDDEMLAISRLSFQADLESLRLHLSRLTSIARNTSEVEIRSYTKELTEIEAEKERTRSRIQALKLRLEEVKRERKNKLEYDVVAAEIVKLPTRAEIAESLEKLKEQLEQVKAENAKYGDISTTAAARMAEVVTGLEGLHNDVGYEVGERERREVERGDGEAEAEAVDVARAEEGSESGQRRSRRQSADEGAEEIEEGEDEDTPTSRLSASTERGVTRAAVSGNLNPSAPAFKPSPISVTTSKTTGAKSRKRDSAAVTASDEEGEVDDQAQDPSSNTNTPRKRQRTNESKRSGEEGEVDGESEEEEEGSIQPVGAAAGAGTHKRP